MTDAELNLIQTQTSRAFLKIALDIFYAKKGRVNLADFSRRCGLSSRSYLNEVLRGKKNLSPEALGRIKSALKLPRLYGKYLEALVLAEKNERDPSFDLSKLRMQIKKESSNESKAVDFSKLAKSSTVFQVYAALGNEETGASLSEICHRTGLEISVAAKALEVLGSNGALRIVGTRYFAVASQLDFLGLRDKEGLASLCEQVGRDLQKNSRQILAKDSNLIFYSAYSISQYRLPILKEKIRAAISEIIDQEQNDNGDAVVQIFLGSWKS